MTLRSNGNHQSGDLTHLRPSSGGTREGSATAPRAADTRLRRGTLSWRLWQQVDLEPDDIRTDADRLIRLMARLGEASVAYDSAHTDIDGEIMAVAVTALAWLEARQS